MVIHVQHAGFSDGVASLEMPATHLQWKANAQGTWVLFELQIIRQEGSAGGARVLRDELAAYLVPLGGVPAERNDIVELLQEAQQGPSTVNIVEATRAYHAALACAHVRLTALLTEVTEGFGGDAKGIVPQDIRDVGLAWVVAGV